MDANPGVAGYLMARLYPIAARHHLNHIGDAIGLWMRAGAGDDLAENLTRLANEGVGPTSRRPTGPGRRVFALLVDFSDATIPAELADDIEARHMVDSMRDACVWIGAIVDSRPFDEGGGEDTARPREEMHSRAMSAYMAIQRIASACAFAMELYIKTLQEPPCLRARRGPEGLAAHAAGVTGPVQPLQGPHSGSSRSSCCW